MGKSLWQLLLHKDEEPLTCADCFAILEYLSDMNDAENVDQKALVLTARHHLQTCPDCQSYYQRRLDELEISDGEL